MSGFIQAMLMAGQNPGALSGTMTTSAVLQANIAGYSNGQAGGPLAGGVVTAATFPSGLTLSALYDNSSTFKFNVQITDLTDQLLQTAFTQIVINGNTFLTSTATFFASFQSVATWQWTNGGVAQTGSGRTYAIT